MGLKSLAKRSEGQVLILTAFVLLALIALCALAIDLGMAYAVKAKLNSAVDAAALEAGRSVKNGADDSTRRQNATLAANSFFAANFPAGIMGSTNRAFSIDKLEPNAGTWTIDVSASAVAPVFFGRMFNNPITVFSSAEATIKTLDMMIVLDCSGSLDPPYSPSGTFDDLKSAAINFVNGFQDGSGGDRIGLVTFASGAVLNDSINKDATRGFTKSSLTAHINAARADGATNAEEAMRIAKHELDAIPADIRSTMRVIVFFSDGSPNIVSGQFLLSDGSTTPKVGLYSVPASSTCATDAPADSYIVNQRSGSVQCYTTTAGSGHGATTVSAIASLPATETAADGLDAVSLASFNGIRTFSTSPPVHNTWCDVNKAARNMVENLANAARGGAGNSAITIYSIGLGDMLKENEVACYSGDNEFGANILQRLANATGVDTYNAAQPTGTYVYAADSSQLNSAFQKIRSIILRLSK